LNADSLRSSLPDMTSGYYSIRQSTMVPPSLNSGAGLFGKIVQSNRFRLVVRIIITRLSHASKCHDCVYEWSNRSNKIMHCVRQTLCFVHSSYNGDYYRFTVHFMRFDLDM